MSSFRPLSEQLRPQHLKEVEGQEHVVGEEGLLSQIIKAKKPLSILLWGPPGCGKTTIAKLYASSFDLEYYALSPIHHGIADLKKIVEQRKNSPLFAQRPLMIFVDEIHRFNKSQQDFFLPYVEEGSLILVGATTENPSFALNSALLSRLRVLTLRSLSEASLEKIIDKYIAQTPHASIDPSVKTLLVRESQGDARHLCNLLENAKTLSLTSLTQENIAQVLQKRRPNYDSDGDCHYRLISALHKSLRGSDPQASLYYLARMLQGGEDPHFIARRLVRVAVEDIGLADPQAMGIALQAWEAFNQLGSPEGDLALASCVVYLALAPKSNRMYVAYKKAQQDAENTSHLQPPSTIVNAPTKLMKEMGFGEGYIYDPDTPEGFSAQEYFPKEMGEQTYYTPVERGFEREMLKRLHYFQQLKKNLRRGCS